MITNYWNNLNERERWMASIGSVCAFFYLFYLLVYSPLSSAVATQSKQLIEKKEILAWMEQIRQQPKLQKAQTLSNTKLLALIGKQLNDKAFKAFPYQLQQTGPGDIQLSFDRIPYKQLLAWLWTLNKDYAITLKQFIAERSDAAGLVKITLLIAAK